MIYKVWTYKVYPHGWAIGCVPLSSGRLVVLKSLDVLWWTNDDWARMRGVRW